MGYKDMIDMDEIEKFNNNIASIIQPNKKEFCNGLRGLRKFHDELKKKKPKWLKRFIGIAEYFGVPFFNEIMSLIHEFKLSFKHIKDYNSEKNLSEDILLKQCMKIYFPILKDQTNEFLKKANTFVKSCKRKKEQIETEIFPEIIVKTPEYLFVPENDYSESIPEITDINESVLDIKYYLNMFIDILIENLSEIIEKIKTEMLKFETQTINKSSSMYNNLLKLSFGFQTQVKIYTPSY